MRIARSLLSSLSMKNPKPSLCSTSCSLANRSTPWLISMGKNTEPFFLGKMGSEVSLLGPREGCVLFRETQNLWLIGFSRWGGSKFMNGPLSVARVYSKRFQNVPYWKMGGDKKHDAHIKTPLCAYHLYVYDVVFPRWRTLLDHQSSDLKCRFKGGYQTNNRGDSKRLKISFIPKTPRRARRAE